MYSIEESDLVNNMSVSAVVPVYNSEMCLKELTKWLDKVLGICAKSYEMILMKLDSLWSLKNYLMIL